MGRIITVSREFGTLGRPLAKKVAEKLNFRYMDPELLERAAVKLGKTPEELEIYDNQRVIYTHLDGSKYVKMAHPLGLGDDRLQRKLFQAEKEIMLKEAEKEDLLIVGRAADYIFSGIGKEDLLRIHICAPYEYRFQKAVEYLKMSKTEAREHIRIIDKARGAFYKQITGEDFRSPLYRDLILNVENCTEDSAINTICAVASVKFHLS